MRPRQEMEQVRLFSPRFREDDSGEESLSGADRIDDWKLKLEHIAQITYVFWKPIVLPIDVTVTVPTK